MRTPSATVAVSAVLLVLAVGVGSAFVLDVDGDGISTHEEVGATDPFSADTDGDGLTDADEYWARRGTGTAVPRAGRVASNSVVSGVRYASVRRGDRTKTYYYFFKN